MEKQQANHDYNTSECKNVTLRVSQMVYAQMTLNIQRRRTPVLKIYNNGLVEFGDSIKIFKYKH